MGHAAAMGLKLGLLTIVLMIGIRCSVGVSIVPCNTVIKSSLDPSALVLVQKLVALHLVINFGYHPKAKPPCNLCPKLLGENEWRFADLP